MNTRIGDVVEQMVSRESVTYTVLGGIGLRARVFKYYRCAGCPAVGGDFTTGTAHGLLAHLKEHHPGSKIPAPVLDGIRRMAVRESDYSETV